MATTFTFQSTDATPRVQIALGHNRSWRGVLLLPAGLLAGGGTAYIRQISVISVGGFRAVGLNVSTSISQPDYESGPELTPAWERSASALSFAAPGRGSITIKGPTHPDSVVMDSTEPYSWRPDNYSALVTWLNALSSTDRVSITLSDGLGVPSAIITAGTPTLSAGGQADVLEYRLLVDWDGTGVYSDEWSHVERISKAQVGRDYASQIYGLTLAGAMDVVLTNDDGRYTPGNPQSPIGQNVRTQRIIGLQAYVPSTSTSPARTWNLWWGYIDKLDLIPRRGQADDVRIRALGVLSLLTQRKVSTPLRENITVANAVTAVLDAVGLSAAQRGPIGGSRIMTRWFTNQSHASESLHELEETEEGFVREQRIDGAAAPQVVFEASDYRLTGDRRVSQYTFSDDVSDTAAYAIVKENLDELTQDIANIIEVPLRTYDDTLVEQQIWRLGQSVTLAAGETLTFIAEYPVSTSPAAHLGVRSWTAMTAQTDYQGNSQADGLGADRTALLSVSTTDTATSRRIEVENTSTTTEVILTLLQTRGVPLAEATPTKIEVRDADSVTAYGPLPYAQAAQFLSTADEAVSYATFTLRQVSQPRLRGDLTFDATDMVRAGIRPPDLSDRVTVSLKGSNTEMFVEAVNHRILRGGRHLIELRVSPADTYAQIIILSGTYPAGHARAGQVEAGGPGLNTGILSR